jgi:preprotein translocase subunit SecA
MYHKLSGMTGTAVTEAGEFWDIYKLDVVEVPTNRDVVRTDGNDRIYKTQREKYNAVIEEVERMRNSGRPTLVGTTSVEISELLSKMLSMRKIPHQVLNAKLHQKEADIVAQAGRSIDGLGTVTIATNMAGRGTDIKLSPEVKAAGGLAIIGTERHESRRVDRQLRGRSGRQGDPGSSVFYVSLEDKLMRLFASERIAKVMDRLGFEDGEMIEHSMITRSIENAQKKVEENHFGVRKRLLEYDDVMNKQRSVIYEKRRHALMGERLGMDIADMIWDRVCHIMEGRDYQNCREQFLEILAMEFPLSQDRYESGKIEELAEEVYQKAMERFKQKCHIISANAHKAVAMIVENPDEMPRYENIMVPVIDGRRVYQVSCNIQEAYESQSQAVVTAFHKSLILHTIDDAWKENLRLLDELKHSVHNASYEQKDPLLIYKLESVKYFDQMVNKINDRVVSVLMRAQVPELQIRQAEAPVPPRPQQRLQESHENIDEGMRQAASRDTREQQPVQPVRRENLPGRNDLCPCGSGKKFKHCHGRNL